MVSATLYAGLLCSLAGPSLGVVLESLAYGVPAGWSYVDTPSDSTTMALSVALARKNIDQLESKLAKVSTPGSADYGKYLDIDEIEAEFPTVSDDAVVSWLKSAGVTAYTRSGSLLHFSATVETVNAMLNTTFDWYQKGDSTKLRTTEYSIPDDLVDYIELISPTVYFGKTVAAAAPVVHFPSRTRSLEARSSSSTVASPCETSITPSCIYEMYSLGGYEADANSGSRIAFGSFLNQTANEADLVQYEKHFSIPVETFSVELINGGVNNQSAGIDDVDEADLDAELIATLAHPLPIHEYITGSTAPYIPDADEPTEDENEPYLIYYEYLLSRPNSAVPQVITNSYGDDEQTVPEYYAKRVCNLIGLMGLRGISILESSGDEGVGSACQASDGVTPQFNPIFPATCPYVTAVGGTQAFSPEVGWTDSSGGFSYYFPRAWYQASAVDHYLDTYVSAATKEYYGQYTDFSGRGFPDVAAHSFTPDFEIVYKGEWYGSGGTSASSPVFAGVVALLNDVRLRAGKPALGFLNPWLYSEGFKALNDIINGTSIGCDNVDPQTGEYVNGSLAIPGAHWNATVGWDPVTGLGTPNFQKLKEAVLAF
ncbi:hypothetical protein ASPZODRAFT_56189 [Penicilliopsis zonata CBS 506.65]|uniref:tripeptidyl-peptidase II n=1 Tax=Penicilliopsis zonata CBS 506.65 TaxID=1073090 RepID=A0A1L9SX66_9EURO|nr:hypothetical protein ASPZODRAFT_56189 [Penicilliopsis zonata CBS 506.65]OJJ51792.1 hypothetical protein ASPZODRAFT_56189 [Penicilliopsis zonata CBS 506.65]